MRIMPTLPRTFLDSFIIFTFILALFSRIYFLFPYYYSNYYVHHSPWLRNEFVFIWDVHNIMWIIILGNINKYIYNNKDNIKKYNY